MQKVITTKNSQRGFIGSILMLATIVGLIVILFAGRVIYNKFADQNEIFSFSAFDYTFRMTQEQSLKSKIKDGLNKAIDGVEKGAKDATEATKEVLQERGVNDAIKDFGKQSKAVGKDVQEKIEVTINGQDVSEKDAQKITQKTVDLVGSVFESLSNSVENLKKE